MGLGAQMTHWLPNWLVVFVLVQLVAGWQLLSDFGVVEMVLTQAQAAEQSLGKLIEMIPRHKSE